MQITRKITVNQNVKTLVAYLNVRYPEDAYIAFDGKTFEEVAEDGSNLPDLMWGEWDIQTKYKSFINRYADKHQKLAKLVINIDRGIIKNWRPGIAMQIHWKVVDEGLYQYYDEDNTLMCEYEGYVPDELGVVDNSYGDYVIMNVDEHGVIEQWDYVKHRVIDTINEVTDDQEDR